MNQADYLLNEVGKIVTKDKEGESVFWKNEIILAALEEFHRGKDDKDKIAKFYRKLSENLHNFESESTSKKMIDIIKTNEEVILANDDSMLDHLNHVLSVYLTGYLIINKGKQFFTNDLMYGNLKKVFNLENGDKEIYFDYLNNVWFYAAFMHDIGYPLEKYNTINKTHKKISDFFALGYEIQTTIPPISTLIRTSKKELDLILYIFNLQKYGFTFTNKKLRSFIRYVLNDNERDDHAVISAIAILKHFGNRSPIISYAAYSIFFHNFKNKDNKTFPFKLDFLKDPISVLLILCDEAQRWKRERETHLFDKYYKNIELQYIDIDACKDYLNVIIDLNYSTDYFEELKDNLSESYGKTQSLLESRLLVNQSHFEIKTRINNKPILPQIVLGDSTEKIKEIKPRLCQISSKCPLGVTEIYNNTQDHVLNSLLEANHSYGWIGLSANNIVTDANISSLMKKISKLTTNKSIKYSFTILNPECKDILKDFDKWREHKFMLGPAKKTLEAGIGGINKLIEVSEQNRDKMEIEKIFHEKFPKLRILIIDNEKIYISYYEKKKNAMDCHQLLIEKSEDAILFNWFKWYYEQNIFEIKRWKIIKKVLKARVEKSPSLNNILEDVRSDEEVKEIIKNYKIEVNKEYIKNILKLYGLKYVK